MKKYFSDEQIISILREAEAGGPAQELCRKHTISDTTSTLGARSLAGWNYPKCSGLSYKHPRKSRQ